MLFLDSDVWISFPWITLSEDCVVRRIPEVSVAILGELEGVSVLGKASFHDVVDLFPLVISPSTFSKN